MAAFEIGVMVSLVCLASLLYSISMTLMDIKDLLKAQRRF